MGIMISMGVNAADIYGLSEQNTQKMMKKYGKELSVLDAMLQKEVSKSYKDEKETLQSQDQLQKKKQDLINKIMKDNGFLSVDLQVVFYPDENQLYSTLEVIDKQHPSRMRFLNTAAKASSDETRVHQPDLIESMITYEKLGFNLMMHKAISTHSPCPVYHCIAGFDHPKLKPYLKMFNQGSVQEKNLIEKTLNEDVDPVRRAAAVFLVGHFHDPHEILNVLSSHIADKDDGVRNNVMRVIGSTLQKTSVSHLDVTPFLDALDSPYTTDRNKALYVLSSVAKSKDVQQQILTKGSDKLLALIRLKQPNNHDLAYFILKEMSGQDFGPTNVEGWRHWLTNASNQHVSS